MPDRRALITGVAGQDGTYLAELLLSRGIEVHGLVRSADSLARSARELKDVHVHVADIRDAASVTDVMRRVAPCEVYNLAGNTSVADSWRYPSEAAQVIGLGALHVLDAAWQHQERSGDRIRVLQASSAEVFGNPDVAPQSESTELKPVTPYGTAKVFAQHMTAVYRQRGLFAVSAILYNHESPRRPATFVARKISRAVAEISLGLRSSLALGNTTAVRDWGYAPDYVRAMWLLLSADRPEDAVVATGSAHTVEDFVSAAFAVVGIADPEAYVVLDPALQRPTDPVALVGDATRIRRLGWSPSLDFHGLVRLLVEADVESLRRTAPAHPAT